MYEQLLLATRNVIVTVIAEGRSQSVYTEVELKKILQKKKKVNKNFEQKFFFETF